MINKIAIFMLLCATSAQATGHFPHERGKVGDWFWRDISGAYSARTNGLHTPSEHFSVFCNNPTSFGGVAFAIGVQGTQIGDRRLLLAFDNGATVDVIATYGHVSAASPAGQSIIYTVLAQLRASRAVQVFQQGSPVARFSLDGAAATLTRCP